MSVARFEDIRKDIEAVVQSRDYASRHIYNTILVLPYELLIFTEEKFIGMTSDFKKKTIKTERMCIVGQDSLYGFPTKYDPDSPIQLKSQAVSEGD